MSLWQYLTELSEDIRRIREVYLPATHAGRPGASVSLATPRATLVCQMVIIVSLLTRLRWVFTLCEFCKGNILYGSLLRQSLPTLEFGWLLAIQLSKLDAVSIART